MTLRIFTPNSVQHARAFCSSPKSPPKKILVCGVTSHIAQVVVKRALNEGYDVWGTSRRDAGFIETEHFHARTIQDVTDPMQWKKFAAEAIHEGDEVVVLNAMGGAYPEKGKTLADLNIVPVMSAVEGILPVVRQWAKSKHVVQLSSIATEGISEHPYVQVKREGDALFLKELSHATVLRVGYGLNTPVEKEKMVFLSVEHDYSGEQSALLPLHPVIGDGTAPIQPVAIEDIAQAICNSVGIRGRHSINAVGSEVIAQKQFLKFFTDMLGRKHRVVEIPIDAAALLTKHIPKGHFASYAVDYCRQGGMVLDHKPFEDRVMRPLLTMNDIYAFSGSSEIVLKAPPLFEHMKEAVGKITGDPEARRDILSAVYMIMMHNLRRT